MFMRRRILVSTGAPPVTTATPPPTHVHEFKINVKFLTLCDKEMEEKFLFAKVELF